MTAALEHPTDDPDRRVAPRIRTLKRAKILFNNNFSTFDCIVRNVSATGALLTMDPAVHLPKTFDIRIGEETQARPAKLVYRRELFAGIHFLDGENASDEVPAPLGARKVSQESAAAPAVEEAARPIRRIIAEPLPVALRRHFPWF